MRKLGWTDGYTMGLQTQMIFLFDGWYHDMKLVVELRIWVNGTARLENFL